MFEVACVLSLFERFGLFLPKQRWLDPFPLRLEVWSYIKAFDGKEQLSPTTFKDVFEHMEPELSMRGYLILDSFVYPLCDFINNNANKI